MAVGVARTPAVSGLVTTRNDGESRKRGPVVQRVVSTIELKQSTRVAGFLHRCPLFATHLRSNGRGKCGSPVTVCGAKDTLFDQRASSALRAGAEELADAVGITAWPRAFLLTTGNEETKIVHPYFTGEDNMIAFGDAAFNPANRSHVINTGATRHLTGSCGEVFCGKKVRIQDVATGRVASFSTSFSFTFTTQGTPRDNVNNSRVGSGFGFILMPSIIQATIVENLTLQLALSTSCKDGRSHNGLYNPPGFLLIFTTEYAPHRHQLSNNVIELARNYDYELENPAYTHNLCGNNATHCSYFSNGKIFTAWVDFSSTSKTLEVRLANGSYPSVKKPLQPLLFISNYTLPKDIGDDVFLSFWGNSDVNHVEAHELLSWFFFSSGISEINIPSSQMLLYFSRARTWVGIMIAVLGTVAAMVILWSISWFARPSRNHYRYSSLGCLAVGPHVFSYAELQKATDNFDKRNLLGSGGSGFVYRGCLEGGSILVAVKQINFSESQQAKAVFYAEVSSLGQARHRNVVQLHGWCEEKGRLLLVYDFMPNGSLHEWLHKSGGCFQRGVLSLEMRHSILEGVGAALEYLHEDCLNCIVHRDIKSSNVLLDADFKAHLGDFGLARLMDHQKLDKTTLAVGTLGYMAPEMPYIGKATKESYVYSFGVLVLEVVCGRRPLDMQAVDPEDLVLLYRIWQAHEVGSLLSMVDPRLLQTHQLSSLMLQDESISATNLFHLPLESQNLNTSNIPSSLVVDVDIEVRNTMVVNLLRLGLLCCLPNPKARPLITQVNGLLHQIGDINNISLVSMPSLPAMKPLGLYCSLEFSQTTISSTSSSPSISSI